MCDKDISKHFFNEEKKFACIKKSMIPGNFHKQLSMRCAGLTVEGTRCMNHSKNQMCNSHKSQIGRILVTCNGENDTKKSCYRKKWVPIHKADDGSILFDLYLCKSHRGKCFTYKKKQQYLIENAKNNDIPIYYRFKFEGIWFYDGYDSKCRGCNKVLGQVNGFYCFDCAKNEKYTTIKQCTGKTSKGNRCRHEKKMMSNDPDYVCCHHKKIK